MKLIEVQNVEKDVTVAFGPESGLNYAVYCKDGASRHHILKTVDQRLASAVYRREQEEYTIEEIYVQIQNNSGEEKETEVSFEIKGKKEDVFVNSRIYEVIGLDSISGIGAFLRENWYLIVIVGVGILFISGLIVYIACLRKKIGNKEISEKSDKNLNETDAKSEKNMMLDRDPNEQYYLSEKNTIKKSRVEKNQH